MEVVEAESGVFLQPPRSRRLDTCRAHNAAEMRIQIARKQVMLEHHLLLPQVGFQSRGGGVEVAACDLLLVIEIQLAAPECRCSC